MTALETDAIATGAASWAANLARISDLQDEVELLRIGLSDATQRLALYRADAVNTAALLRQERERARALSWALMAALFWYAGVEHEA